MTIYRSILIFCVTMCATAMLLFQAPLPVSCQESEETHEQIEHSEPSPEPSGEPYNDQTKEQSTTDSSDLTYFFAFLAEDPQPLRGGIVEYFRDKPFARDFISPHDKEERKFRPMLQWRRWADRHQRFFPALGFIAFTSTLIWSLIPGILQAASEESRKSFWRCFGTGALMAALTMILTRSVFQTQLGWPLGILLAGLSQAAMLVGLAVAVFNLGHSVLLLAQLNKINALSKNPAAFRVGELLVGSLLAALLLQIPPLGPVPQVGTRLLALFALLGVGSIYRILRRPGNAS